jgi:hypothetical protein
VDQLMIYEELTGKDLKTIAKEYISTLNTLEVLYDTRQSSLFDLMIPELKKSITEVEDDANQLFSKLLLNN